MQVFADKCLNTLTRPPQTVKITQVSTQNVSINMRWMIFLFTGRFLVGI